MSVQQSTKIQQCVFFTDHHVNCHLKVLSKEPCILHLRGLLSAEECQQLIELGRPSISRSATVNPETGENQVIDYRTSDSTYLTLGQTPVVKTIEARLAKLTEFPVVNGEALQILRYQDSQYYKPHYDYFDPAWNGSAKILACGGQRVISCVMYLNTVEAGGETHFPNVDITVPAVQGNAVLFFNTKLDGSVEPLSMHASLPIISGEKWAATKWIRENEYCSPPTP